MLGVFLDIETNGLNPFLYKPIEIAFWIINMETGEKLESYTSVISMNEQEWKNSDPTSLKINGFTLTEVLKGKPIEVVSQEIQEIFIKYKIERGSSVFICQNPSFDRPFFTKILPTELQEKLLLPYHWLDLASMHWAVSFQKKPLTLPWITGLTKDKIAIAYQLPPESKPHRAMNGVNHLILCYENVLGYPLKK